MEQSSPIVFAHRGANQLAPENTLAAFQLAHDLGAEAFEFDVQLSKDGIPVVIHDETLDRTTTGHGLVSDHTCVALQKLDAGSWFANEYSHEKISTLEEALERLLPWGALLNIELKENALGAEALVEAVLEVLSEAQVPKDQIILSSFHPSVMQALVSEKAPYALAWLMDEVNPKAYPLAKNWHCLSINPNVKILELPDSRFIQDMKSQGLKVFSYTINHEALAEALLAQGLDGFFTDNELLYGLGK